MGIAISPWIVALESSKMIKLTHLFECARYHCFGLIIIFNWSFFLLVFWFIYVLFCIQPFSFVLLSFEFNLTLYSLTLNRRIEWVLMMLYNILIFPPPCLVRGSLMDAWFCLLTDTVLKVLLMSQRKRKQLV